MYYSLGMFTNHHCQSSSVSPRSHWLLVLPQPAVSDTDASFPQYCWASCCSDCRYCCRCNTDASSSFFLAWTIACNWSYCPCRPAFVLVRCPASYRSLFTSYCRNVAISSLPYSPAANTSAFARCFSVSRMVSRSRRSPATFPLLTSDTASYALARDARVLATVSSRTFLLAVYLTMSSRFLSKVFCVPVRWLDPWVKFCSATDTSRSRLTRVCRSVLLLPTVSKIVFFNELNFYVNYFPCSCKSSCNCIRLPTSFFNSSWAFNAVDLEKLRSRPSFELRLAKHRFSCITSTFF